MQNKRRFFVFVVFVLCMFFLMTFAGGTNNRAIATRDVEFVDGFDNKTIDLQKVEVGKDAEVPKDPKHEDYVFAGWFLYDNHDVKVTNFKKIMKDLKVIALYADDRNNNGVADEEDEFFTVTFVDSITNNVIKTQDVLVGLDATAPKTPVHKGFMFTGWSHGYRNVKANITTTALYEKDENNDNIADKDQKHYNVTYVDYDDEVIKEFKDVLVNLSTPTIENPERQYYEFKGWEPKVAEKVIAHATYKATYSPINDANGDGIADEEQETFTITYVDYDNTIIAQVKDVLINIDTPTLAKNPTRKGYVFAGWNPEVAEKVTADATYKATYDEDKDEDGIADKNEKKYTITYKLDANDKDAYAVYENQVDGIATPVPANPDKEYAVFNSWTPAVAKTVTEDATYVAVWDEDLNNDNIPDDKQNHYTVAYVDYDDSVIKIFANRVINIATPTVANPEREFYTFTGWDPEVAKTVTENVTYKATYVPINDENKDGIADEEQDKFTVKYVDYNDEQLAEYSVLINLETPTITNPIRKGYVFAGWNPAVASTVTKNVTYKATYDEDKDEDGKADKDENKYTVTYKLEADDETAYKVYEDQVDGIATPVPENPDKEYAVFAGWNPEVAATVTKDATYVAVWDEDKNNDNIPDKTQDKFTVKYVDYNDEQLAEYSVLINLETPTINNPTRKGYVFAGWDPEVAKTVTADATYKATYDEDKDEDGKADKDENKYTVTYKLEADDENAYKVYEDQVDGIATPVPENPDKEYAVFAGWNPEVAATVTKDVTYVAVWEADMNNDNIADKDQNLFTVTYMNAKEVFKKYEYVLENSTTPIPTEVPVKNEYYTFTGWDPEVAKTVTENVIYKATYAPINDENKDGIADEEQEHYTITYIDYDGKELSKFEDVLINLSTPTVQEPIRKGYVFAGWEPTVAETVTADATYKATYDEDKDEDGKADKDENKYTVTYKLDADDVAVYKVYENQVDGIATPIPEDPDKEYAVFAGWNPKVAEKVTADATYVAVWDEDLNNDNIPDKVQNKYTITYVNFDNSTIKEFANQVVNIATPTIEDPERQYYEFTGWEPEVAATVTENATYKATYKPFNDENKDGVADEEQNHYTVTYVDYDDNTLAEFKDVLINLPTPDYTEPTREGYVFTGWDPEVAKTVTADVTYKATYKEDKNGDGEPDENQEHYTITYVDYDGTELNKFEEVLVNLETPTITNPTRKGYVFAGWEPEVAKTVTADATYKATYDEDKDEDGKADKDENKYTVTYKLEADDENAYKVYEDQVDGIATPVPENPDKEYAVFAGWNPEVAATVTKDATYVAVWDEDKNNDNIPDKTQDKFTVKYVNYDDEVIRIFTDQVVNIATPTIADPDRANYRFTGWEPEVAKTVTENVTYKATYAPINDENKDGIADEEQSRIIFKDFNGDVLYNELVTNGQATPVQENPTREYYNFTGWNPEVAKTVTEDATYIATYVPINDENKDGVADEEQSRVIFKDYDGKVLYNNLVTKGENTPVVTEPTRNYYTFAGWNPTVAIKVTADVTYTATYKPINDKNKDGIADEEQTLWEVKFHGFNNDTQVGETQWVVDGEAAIAPTPEVVAGFKFVNWLQDFSNITADLDVYASYVDVAAPVINANVVLYNEKDGAYQNANITATVTDNVAVKTVKYLKGNQTDASAFANAPELTVDANGKYAINGLTENSLYTIYAEDTSGNVSLEVVEVEGITVLTGDFEDLYATGSFGNLSGFPIIGTYKKPLTITTKPNVRISDARAFYGDAYKTIADFENDKNLGTAIENDGKSLNYTIEGHFFNYVTVYVQYAYEEEVAPGIFQTKYVSKLYKTRLSYLWGE